MKKELKSINKTEKRKTNIYVKKTKRNLKHEKHFQQKGNKFVKNEKNIYSLCINKRQLQIYIKGSCTFIGTQAMFKFKGKGVFMLII